MDKVVLQSFCERHDEHFALGIVSEVGSQTTDEDACVGADGGFRIGLEPGEVAEEVVVQDTLSELEVGNDETVKHSENKWLGLTLSERRLIDFTVASRMTATVSENPVC